MEAVNEGVDGEDCRYLETALNEKTSTQDLVDAFVSVKVGFRKEAKSSGAREVFELSALSPSLMRHDHWGR